MRRGPRPRLSPGPRLGGGRVGVPAAPAFDPAALPGAYGLWAFDEGAGFRVANRVPPARTLVNLVPVPEGAFGFSSCWNLNGAGSVADAYAPRPDGAAPSASRLVWTGTGGYLEPAFPLQAPAGTYTLSLWVRSNTGSAQVVRLAGNNFGAPSADLPVTTAWARVSYTFTAGGSFNPVYVRQGSADPATDVLIWGMQLEVGSTATAYQAPQGDILLRSSSLWSAAGVTSSGTGTLGWIGLPAPLTLAPFTAYVAFRQTAAASAYLTALASATGFDSWSLSLTGSGSFPGCFYRGNPLPTAASNGNVGKFLNTNDSLGHVLAVSYDGTTSRVLLDGTEVYAGTSSLTPLTVPGLLLGGNGQSFTGDYSAIGYHAGAHTLAQMRGWTGWAQQRLVSRGRDVTGVTELVVFAGDSLSANPTTWTETVAQNLAAPGRQFRNDGWGGTCVAVGARAFSPDRLAGIAAGAGPNLRRKVCVVAFGTNDYTNTTAAGFYSDLKAACGALVAQGWRVAVATCPSAGGTGSTQNAGRATNNPLILANAVAEGWAHATIDFGGDSIMGLDSTTDGTPNEYYFDPLHPNGGGNPRLAALAQPVVVSLLA